MDLWSDVGLEDPRLTSEFCRKKIQSREGDQESLLRDREWIEKEANYVDEVILRVGKRKEASKILADSLSNVYYLSLGKPGFCKQLLTLLTPEERVDFVCKYFTEVNIPPEVVEKYQKNAETSTNLRDRGTELYKQRNFHDALHYYTLALMFAEDETELAGIAYANRSAVLVELGRFQDALQDIELALKSKYPESRLARLEERRERCQESIQKKREDYLAIGAKVRKEIEAEIQDMRSMRNEILQLKEPNPLIPAAADCVEINFDKTQGRHLVVNRNVTPGTVLIVEKPYVFTLYGQSKWDTEHCHHCLKRIIRGIPCNNCVFAIYCNEQCRNEAITIHRYECKCLPSFHAIYAVDQVLAAMRIILKVGQKELFRLFRTQDPMYFSPQQPFGTAAGCMYDSQSYLGVFHLATNSEWLDRTQKVANTSHALIATAILESKTDFFEDIPVNFKGEFKKFVAALMLRHIEADAVNAAAIVELQGLENVSFADSFTEKIAPEKLSEQMKSLRMRKFGGAMYPFFSLMNHSCDANVCYLNDVVNGTMIVMAHRALKKGEPLFISYNGGFTCIGSPDRQAKLDRCYHFECRCIACEQNWPTLLELRDRDSIFCCPTCSKKFFQYEKGSKEFKKCLLAHPRWMCGLCGSSYSEGELAFRFEDSMGQVEEIYRYLKLNRPRKAFDIFLKLFGFFQYHLCPPDGQMYNLQELFRKTVALNFYHAQ